MPATIYAQHAGKRWNASNSSELAPVLAIFTFPYYVSNYNRSPVDRESGGMADAPDLGSGAARRGGSSPPSRTKGFF